MVDLNLKLPDNFLKEEVRCDYTISHKMKELWAVELDLLMELDRVCRKYDITYTIDGGSILGAVRHGGFIPWDDDIDIAMLRSEYERLNEVAPREFKAPYFWQTEETDPGSMRGHAQLRNSNTTAILASEQDRNMQFNQGIFVDIFPFDNISDDQNEVIEQYNNVVRYKNKALRDADITVRYSYEKLKKYSSFKHRLKMTVLHIWAKTFQKDLNYKDAYQAFVNECKKFNGEKTKRVADYVIPLSAERNARTKESFTNIKKMKFEFLELPVPQNYDEILSTVYGDDYMTFKKGGSSHGGLIFDTNKSYKEYKKQ